jgi:hypothetical protein
MPTQRMYWTGILNTSGNLPSIPVDDESMRIRETAWHAYVSGTPGASLQLQIAYSPDTPDTPDASSRWFAPTALLFGTIGDTYFTAKFRKARPEVVSGGDGTTSLTVEIR